MVRVHPLSQPGDGDELPPPSSQELNSQALWALIQETSTDDDLPEVLPPDNANANANTNAAGAASSFSSPSPATSPAPPPDASSSSFTGGIRPAPRPGPTLPPPPAPRLQQNLPQRTGLPIVNGTHGSLMFVDDGVGERRQQPSERPVARFIRLDRGFAEANPARIVDFLISDWGLSVPGLLISVTGGAASFNLPSRLDQTVKEGLVRAAELSHGWLLSGGSRSGCMRLVGEAVEMHRNMTVLSGLPHLHAQIPLLGICAWPAVEAAETLEQARGALQRYSATSTRALDPNHTHFIGIDDREACFATDPGRVWGSEIPFRAALEAELGERLFWGPCDAEMASSSVCVVIQGGPNTLRTACAAVDAGTPLVLIKGSKGAADILTATYIFLHGDDGDSDEYQHIDDFPELDEDAIAKLRAMILSWQPKSDSATLDCYISDAVLATRDPNKVAVFDPEDQDRSLDAIIFAAVLCNEQRIAMRLDRQHIPSEESIAELGLRRLQQALMWARKDVFQKELAAFTPVADLSVPVHVSLQHSHSVSTRRSRTLKHALMNITNFTRDLSGVAPAESFDTNPLNGLMKWALIHGRTDFVEMIADNRYFDPRHFVEGVPNVAGAYLYNAYSSSTDSRFTQKIRQSVDHQRVLVVRKTIPDALNIQSVRPYYKLDAERRSSRDAVHCARLIAEHFHEAFNAEIYARDDPGLMEHFKDTLLPYVRVTENHREELLANTQHVLIVLNALGYGIFGDHVNFRDLQTAPDPRQTALYQRTSRTMSTNSAASSFSAASTTTAGSKPAGQSGRATMMPTVPNQPRPYCVEPLSLTLAPATLASLLHQIHAEWVGRHIYLDPELRKPYAQLDQDRPVERGHKLFIEVLTRATMQMVEYLGFSFVRPTHLHDLYRRTPERYDLRSLVHNDLSFAGINTLLLQALTSSTGDIELDEVFELGTAMTSHVLMPQPEFAMLVWAILSMHFDIADLLWRRGDDAIVRALAVEALMRYLAQAMPGMRSEDRANFLEQATKFRRYAVDLLSACEHADSKQALDLIFVYHPYLGNMSIMPVAYLAGNDEIVESSTCAARLKGEWRGWLTTSTSHALIFLCLFFPLLVPLLVSFRSTRPLPPSTKSFTTNSSSSILKFYSAPVTAFWLEVISYCATAALFAYVTLLPFEDPRLTPGEVVLLVIMAARVVNEMRRLGHFGLRRWWSSEWNRVDVAGYLLYICSVAPRFSRPWLGVSKAFLALAVFPVYLHLARFYARSATLGPRTLMAFAMLSDAVVFLALLVVVLVPFGIAIHALLFPFRPPDRSTFSAIFYRPFFVVFGELFLDEVEAETQCLGDQAFTSCGSSFGYLVPILMVGYLLITNVLLVNLLIAMFADTYQKIATKQRRVWAMGYFELLSLYAHVRYYEMLPAPLNLVTNTIYFARYLYKLITERKKPVPLARRPVVAPEILQDSTNDRQLAALRQFERKILRQYDTEILQLDRHAELLGEVARNRQHMETMLEAMEDLRATVRVQRLALEDLQSQLGGGAGGAGGGRRKSLGVGGGASGAVGAASSGRVGSASSRGQLRRKITGINERMTRAALAGAASPPPSEDTDSASRPTTSSKLARGK